MSRRWRAGGIFSFLILSVAPVVIGLGAKILAPPGALLLRRAIGVEVVELAPGKHVVVGPLAVLFLMGPLNTPLRRAAGLPFRISGGTKNVKNP